MLRGAQTPGELRARTERLHQFATLEQLDAQLEALAARRLIVRFERRPGQKEARWHLGAAFGDPAETDGKLGERPSVADVSSTGATGVPPRGATDRGADELEARASALERDLAALRAVVARLRDAGG
jgi:uncharacterized protein YceH (UPF0502 family)